MQKQTIIKEATTPALAGREKVYVHFHIEQRVLYQSIFMLSEIVQVNFQQSVSASASAPAGASASASVSVSASAFSISNQLLYFGQVDGIVSYCTVVTNTTKAK